MGRAAPNPSRPPRVLIVPEYGAFGGTRAFLLRLLQIHAVHRLETAVVIPHSQAFADMQARFAAQHVSVFQSPDRRGVFIKPYVALLYDVRMLWDAYRSFRPDLIVVSSGTPGLMLGAMLYAVPVVFVMHTYPMLPFRPGLRRLAAALSRRNRNAVITVSHASAREIHRCTGIPLERIHVVYNVYSECGGSTDAPEPVVLSIGHVEAYKGADTWLHVARRVVAQRPDVRFIWCGEGQLLEPLRAQMAAAGLGARVALPGYCPDVHARYAEAMLCFQPSRVDSHNIAVVEAMAHGLPCIVANTGGLVESVVDGETGFVCAPEDVEAFSARIMELLDSPDLRGRFGAAGRHRAQAVFSSQAQEDKLLGLYRAALAARPEVSL